MTKPELRMVLVGKVKVDEMKRDMDLMLKILRSVEAREDVGDLVPVAVEGYTDDQIGFHVKLLVQGGRLGGRGQRGGWRQGIQLLLPSGALPTRVTTFWKLPMKLPRTTRTGTNLRH